MTTTDILAQLVSFPVFGGDSNLSILTWITDYLDRFGVTYHLVPNEDGSKAALHCRFGPSVDGGVILSGHMDVVPVAGQPWDSDPFVLTEKGDKLYARGSCDMKGFIACCLAAVPELLAAELQKPIYFAFSYDEEIGCQSGEALAAAIRDDYPETALYAIIGEPSMLQPIVGQKGINVYKTTFYGSQGHSSRVKQEVSAVHEAARFTVWLEEYMNELIRQGRTDDRFHPNHTSVHVGVVHGGTAFNIIANECYIDWDYRNIPQDNAAEIFAAAEAYCRDREATLKKRFPDFRITHEAHHPPVVALDTPADATVVALVQELTGNQDISTVSYAAEAGQFSAAGFEAVICGPGSIAQAHRANEYVHKSQLSECDQMLQRLIHKLSAPTALIQPPLAKSTAS
ncbi:MAG: acetylornithine deacetylase [Bacteroidota bacterium]